MGGWGSTNRRNNSASYSRGKNLKRKYSRIADNYDSLEQVTEALLNAGLESCNLIVGIDFTKSNEWTGNKSFNGRCLHHVSDTPNPYELAISIVGRTLGKFDDDNLIPCFGFGDSTTHDKHVFGFFPDQRPCNGFEEVLYRYRELLPVLNLSGRTSFAPIIKMAVTIVEQSGGQYHVLLIIADGQVSREHEKKTIDAIVEASEYPLSIVLVGVGDGPWETMKQFDDNIPNRSFDNFQFVNFTEIMLKSLPQSRKEAAFALAALMEVPVQYKATLELGLLGCRCGKSPESVALPPPRCSSRSSESIKLQRNTLPPFSYTQTHPDATTVSNDSGSSSSNDNQNCPICLVNPKNMAFGCGHQTCHDCGPSLQTCPICRTPIQTRIKLY
ncbi:E3 ubiquitin-protein ligase RGLG2-like protein [Carex littledalei]|uniref:E3 ubiquitin-protein ligase RGLG2-like protein n=1 Tax=Carex littledalei TaxID=544730 RepID=A0A833VVP4_9POAL|nr:E3 ubiquitin-protein ligase RGLG2-like protein [Carex littledalei]